MEERDGPRLLTQRQLEVVSPPPAPGPESGGRDARPAAVATPPAPTLSASNLGLLERQLRWFRERARFDARAREDEGSK